MINQSFQTFIDRSIQKARQICLIDIENRDNFVIKYPLSKIKELTIEEYCLGTEKAKESLSYLMEFGDIGFGIGGGSARKHGVYFNKRDKCYMHGADPIADVDEFWPRFRDQFYRFLVLSGNSENTGFHKGCF